MTFIALDCFIEGPLRQLAEPFVALQESLQQLEESIDPMTGDLRYRRREFLLKCAATAAGLAGLGVSLALGRSARSAPGPWEEGPPRAHGFAQVVFSIERATLEQLSSQVGKRFRVQAGAGEPFDAELLEARSSRRDPWRPKDLPRQIPFSLLFVTRETGILPRGTCKLSHPELGTFELFCAPVGAPGDDVHFEAVFN